MTSQLSHTCVELGVNRIKIVLTMSPCHHNPKTLKKLSILGESMLQELNGFLLKRKLTFKCLVKVRPSSLEKIRYIYGHVKTTV